jgi:hypothetical protein
LLLKLTLSYPRQTDEVVVEPDDSPRGAVIAGLFVGVDFHADRAVLALPEGELEVRPGDPRRFEAAGVPTLAEFWTDEP